MGHLGPLSQQCPGVTTTSAHPITMPLCSFLYEHIFSNSWIFSQSTSRIGPHTGCRTYDIERRQIDILIQQNSLQRALLFRSLTSVMLNNEWLIENCETQSCVQFSTDLKRNVNSTAVKTSTEMWNLGKDIYRSHSEQRWALHIGRQKYSVRSYSQYCI